MLQDASYVSNRAQRGLGMATYAYAANNPVRYVDRTGFDYDNPICWERYYSSDTRTPGRTMQNEGHKQGDSQCICYIREHPPSGSGTDECFYKPTDFTPGESSCPPGLQAGLPSCDSYCKTLAKDFPIKPETANWKTTTCPSTGALSCGGQKIDKYVDRHTCQ